MYKEYDCIAAVAIDAMLHKDKRLIEALFTYANGLHRQWCIQDRIAGRLPDGWKGRLTDAIDFNEGLRHFLEETYAFEITKYKADHKQQ